MFFKLFKKGDGLSISITKTYRFGRIKQGYVPFINMIKHYLLNDVSDSSAFGSLTLSTTLCN